MNIPRLFWLIFSLSQFAIGSFANDFLYQKYSKSVFKVFITAESGEEKVSHGTGFPVRRDGYIATNYHVIDRVFSTENKYKISVNIEGKIIDAEVINFDIVNDLALLKVNKEFSTIFEVGIGEINNGERVYSLGYPKSLNFSIVDGIFNGENNPFGNDIFYVSSPLNSGMSGGPSVDEAGRLVGINVSILRKSNNISFLVPKRFLKSLLEEGINKKYSSENLNDYYQKIEESLLLKQESISEEFFTSIKRKDYLGFEYLTPSRIFDCWEDKIKHSSGKFDVYVNDCRLGFYSGYIDDKLIGMISVRNSFYDGSKLSSPGFMNIIKSDAFHSSFRFPTGKFVDSRVCREFLSKNKNNVNLKISFCVAKMRHHTKIFSGSLKLFSMTKKKKEMLSKVILHGFSKDFINKTFNQFIHGISLDEN
tara:strand:- start:5196 stop:6458 length:1263 start_codon:yes stop_codon:yes gene_type:complete